ncbi:hypothetical protein ABIA24_001753 [Sinorhizobium fredii]|uniref:hypothetical protein n=1 Tax=Rhizobium fredii TaxID=380 RepID=UPI003515D702
MTSEVCMMNRLAVVLAADSATTVTGWNGTAREERYFKGANKIFQLHDMEPVGLMIFDSADLLRVPWELTIKTFRKQLGRKTFNTVEEYAKEFLEYLNDNVTLFPKEVQDETVVSSAQATAVMWVTTAIEDIDQANHQDAVTRFVTERRIDLDDAEYSECLGEEAALKVIADLTEQVISEVKAWLDVFEIAHPDDLQWIAETAIIQVMKRPEANLGTTGLVFAGFGDHQIFPEMLEYLSCGIVGGRHIYYRKRAERIDHQTPTSIAAFAQTSMIDTFTLGLSEDAYASMMLAVDEQLGAFLDEVVAASGGDAARIGDRNSLVQASAKKISKTVLEKARNEHSLPLRRVIGFLPVDEMAELAETLITLQSLKERVTKPSETVGGPVDVAVITKHEGLVWIKRKLFFDSELNSRYKLRQAAQLA